MRAARWWVLGAVALLAGTGILVDACDISLRWCRTTTKEQEQQETSQVRGEHDVKLAQGLVFTKQSGPAQFTDRSRSEVGAALVEELRESLKADPVIQVALLYLRVERNDLSGDWAAPFLKKGSARLVVVAETRLSIGDDPVQRKGTLETELSVEVVGLSSRSDAVADLVRRQRERVTAFVTKLASVE